MKQAGTRAGNWLTKEQANELLNAPNSKTLTGKRDRAILALLLGCGLRRAELLRLKVDDLEQRETRWVVPDLKGNGNRLRLVTVPAGVKARIDAWTAAADVTEGRLFRPVRKSGRLAGDEIKDEKAIWRLVLRYANQTELRKLAPHDLRRTARSSAARPVEISSRSRCYSATPPSRSPSAISGPSRPSLMPSTMGSGWS